MEKTKTGKIIIQHRWRSNWRAIHNPINHTIRYQTLKGEEWITDYTEDDSDEGAWLYTSPGWGYYERRKADDH